MQLLLCFTSGSAGCAITATEAAAWTGAAATAAATAAYRQTIAETVRTPQLVITTYVRKLGARGGARDQKCENWSTWGGGGVSAKTGDGGGTLLPHYAPRSRGPVNQVTAGYLVRAHGAPALPACKVAVRTTRHMSCLYS